MYILIIYRTKSFLEGCLKHVLLRLEEKFIKKIHEMLVFFLLQNHKAYWIGWDLQLLPLHETSQNSNAVSESVV